MSTLAVALQYSRCADRGADFPDQRFRLARVRAAFRAEADRAATERDADAWPPMRPPFRAGALFNGLPSPDPPLRPPPVILLTVAQARRSASS
jgi:hypothetical protein